MSGTTCGGDVGGRAAGAGGGAGCATCKGKGKNGKVPITKK